MSLTVYDELESIEEYLLKENDLYQPLLLDDSFYKGMRNTLTTKKLNSNVELAKKIKEPVFFGDLKSEGDYLEALELFLDCTLETRHRGIFFLKKVLPQLAQKKNLLDIGPGNGQLTKWVGNAFKKVTVLDINKKALDFLNTEKKILRKHIPLNKIHASLLTIKFSPNEYDLVILSHILYYLPRINWLEAVKRAYRAVRPGGILAIAMNGDELDKLHLINFFNGEPITITHLIHCCYETFKHSKIEFFKTYETVKTLDLESMRKIAGFFLYDVNAIATKDELTQYVNTFLKKGDRDYSMRFSQKFILVHKEF